MAQKSSEPFSPIDSEPVRGFDVMLAVSVGFVAYDDNGTHNPIEAAFLCIAKQNRDGTYSFPGPHADQNVYVTVEGME